MTMHGRHSHPPGPPGFEPGDDDDRIIFRPLAGSRFALEVDRALLPLVRGALPLVGADWSGPAHASLCVAVSPLLPAAPPDPAPTLRVSDVAAWVGHARADHVVIHGEEARVHGVVDLGARRGTLRVRDVTLDGAPTAGAAVGIAAALLLGRLGHVLVRAGAVVCPGGTAWLLTGGARSGKSSTCATLIAAGWDYLSDDQVVLSPDEHVEGWQSDFHLDRGWAHRIPTGERELRDPLKLGAGRWRRSASLGGLLFPAVRAEERTRLEPMERSEAFAALVRQSPWLLADPRAAPALVTLLEHITHAPRWRLVLGRDAFGSPERLMDVLRER